MRQGDSLDFNTIARDFGPLVAALIVGAGAVWGTIKLIIPRLTDAWIEDHKVTRSVELAAKQQEQELTGEAAAANRQDEIALLSQVIHLTNQMLAQNKGLLEFITVSMRDDMRGMREEINRELRDIDERWLAASRAMSEGHAKTQILTIEIANLAMRVESVEKDIKIALNGKAKGTG